MSDRLLRPDVKCPDCGKVPRLRIPEAERALSLTLPADQLRQTYQCHHCGNTYRMEARAFQKAA
ncbi:hypothetical protein [Longimicrobium sp.]|jgi:transposase-like protein|uniref:hypothetical protein n=1 Tax=Longimicrobium sp. TaxID=2029185 RepID=UPI002F94B3C7